MKHLFPLVIPFETDRPSLRSATLHFLSTLPGQPDTGSHVRSYLIPEPNSELGGISGTPWCGFILVDLHRVQRKWLKRQKHDQTAFYSSTQVISTCTISSQHPGDRLCNGPHQCMFTIQHDRKKIDNVLLLTWLSPGKLLCYLTRTVWNAK